MKKTLKSDRIPDPIDSLFAGLRVEARRNEELFRAKALEELWGRNPQEAVRRLSSTIADKLAREYKRAIRSAKEGDLHRLEKAEADYRAAYAQAEILVSAEIKRLRSL